MNTVTFATDRSRILQPGETCWRIARASKLAFIIDGADYFALAKAAIGKARHSVYLIGWDFDLRIRLDPDAADRKPPDTLLFRPAVWGTQLS